MMSNSESNRIDLDKSKIFFLHIPKTAGSSVNEMLALGFEKEKVRFHIENDRIEQYRNIDTAQLDMFSGHISLAEVNRYLSLEDFLKVTIVRDPFQQLISHINWVKFISENPESPFFINHPENIKEFSLMLRELDFSDLSAVEVFFNNLPNIGISLFCNSQTRYLCKENVPLVITERDSQKAISGLPFFDIIGTVEKIDNFINEIYSRMNWEISNEMVKTNVLDNKYCLDQNSCDLKEILFPLYCADQVVYNYISRDFNRF